MSGMVGKVQIANKKSELKNQHPSIVIPANCVLLKPEGPTVWVVEQGSAVRRDITVAGYQASGVRVQSGLQEGDTLIIEGYQKLYNGCKVISE